MVFEGNERGSTVPSKYVPVITVITGSPAAGSSQSPASWGPWDNQRSGQGA